MAVGWSASSMLATSRHGLYRAVCGERPALWSASLAATSLLSPTYGRPGSMMLSMTYTNRFDSLIQSEGARSTPTGSSGEVGDSGQRLTVSAQILRCACLNGWQE